MAIVRFLASSVIRSMAIKATQYSISDSLNWQSLKSRGLQVINKLEDKELALHGW